jgi:DNA-binding NarL/FixJ family response regulator
MIRILIVDDHPIVRHGLKTILAAEPDMKVAGEAESADEALALMKKRRWDAVVLDIGMPGRSGLELLKELKATHPDLPVLLLSIYPEEQYAVRGLKLGAAGYVSKDSAPQELVSAIRTALAGGRYVTPAVADRLARALDRGAPEPPHQILSHREFQVLCLIASGKTPTQIARDTGLSVKTIATYRARILEKMGMENNAALTRYAIQTGLVM